MQNVLRSNSCKVCWFGFRKVEVLVVVLSSAVYYVPNRSRVYVRRVIRPGMTMKRIIVVTLRTE